MTTLGSESFERVASLEALSKALKKALAGKRSSVPATKMNYLFMSELLKIQKELTDGTYQTLPYRRKTITEPKVRKIEAPGFMDRIVQHSIHAVLSPFYEKFFINDSYACRPEKGTHKAANRVQKFLRTEDNLYVCKIDISKYYASVNHNKLSQILAKRIDDPRMMKLLNTIISSSDSGTEHDYLFPPDSYFHTKGRRGIPIGNLTSQLFANIYLHEADMYAKHQLRARMYIRYMDDIMIFHKDKAVLNDWKEKMTKFLYEELYLTVNPHKVRIYPSWLGVDFVGFVMQPFSKRVRSSSVKRFRKRFRRHLKNYWAGHVSESRLVAMHGAWEAHVKHGNGKPLADQAMQELKDHKFVLEVQKIHKKQLREQRQKLKKPKQLPLFGSD